MLPPGPARSAPKPQNQNTVPEMDGYAFLDYKTKGDDRFELKSATVLGCDSPDIAKGAAVANAVCFARDLGNHPGNITTPSRLAEAARETGLKF